MPISDYVHVSKYHIIFPLYRYSIPHCSIDIQLCVACIQQYRNGDMPNNALIGMCYYLFTEFAMGTVAQHYKS